MGGTLPLLIFLVCGLYVQTGQNVATCIYQVIELVSFYLVLAKLPSDIECHGSSGVLPARGWQGNDVRWAVRNWNNAFNTTRRAYDHMVKPTIDKAGGLLGLIRYVEANEKSAIQAT